jgi:hypothetical protein
MSIGLVVLAKASVGRVLEAEWCSFKAAAFSSAFAFGVIRKPSCSVLMSGIGICEFNMVITVYSARFYSQAAEFSRTTQSSKRCLRGKQGAALTGGEPRTPQVGQSFTQHADHTT